MSIDEVAHQLNRALAIMPDAALLQAAASIDEAIADLYPLSVDTDQLAEPVQQWQHASAEINHARSLCFRAGELIEEYLAQIGIAVDARPNARSPEPTRTPAPENNDPSTDEPAMEPPTFDGTSSRSSPPIVGVDGSKYPAEAGWAMPELPARWRQRPDRVVGKIKIGDRVIPGSYSSGESDVFSDEAAQRLRTIGRGRLAYLAYHVEIRAASMLRRSGVQDAEVAINHVPCGYQAKAQGCHQVLEEFMPEGQTLTVSGTDRHGQPFRHTYHGKGPQ